MRTRILGLIVPVALVAAAIAACGTTSLGAGAGGRQEVSADYPVYASIEELARQADLVAVVEIGPVLSREIDDGGSGDPDDGIPMAFWKAAVGTVLKGEMPIGSSIPIGWPDLERQPIDERSSLREGQKIVIFARRLTPVDAPGIKSQDVFYVPAGGDNGVLDFDGSGLVPRSAGLDRLWEGEEPQERLRTELSSIREVVQSQR